MHYLNAGSRAPGIPFPEQPYDHRWVGKPGVWRLLWKDERYMDGKVPAEEATYGYPSEVP